MLPSSMNYHKFNDRLLKWDLHDKIILLWKVRINIFIAQNYFSNSDFDLFAQEVNIG